jgi:hypothetical protein
LKERIDAMNSPLCIWLAGVEDKIQRMIIGVFRFAFQRVPEWIYRTLIDVVGPVTVRLIRATVLFAIWLLLVFGPIAATLTLRLSFWWDLGATGWLALAISGGIWGLYRVVRKRKAATLEAVDDDERLNCHEGPSRRAYVGSY